MKIKNKCCMNKCNRPIHVKIHELCAAHYMRWLRNDSVGNKPVRKYTAVSVYKESKQK